MGSALTLTSASERRQQILTAALHAFTEKGVAGASIEDIRQRSGASIGSIYHHFESKDEIAGVLFLEGLADYQQGFLRVVAGATTTQDGVQAAVLHHLSWVRNNIALSRFLLLGRDASLVVATEQPLRRQNRLFFSAVADWARPRVRTGELRDLPAELMSALWVGPSQEFARGWLARRERAAMAAAQSTLPQAAWQALRSPER